MSLNNFVLECEKENKDLRKSVEYYKRKCNRLEKSQQALNEIKELLLTKINKIKN